MNGIFNSDKKVAEIKKNSKKNSKKNIFKKRRLSRLRSHSHLFLVFFILFVQLAFYIFICLKILPYTRYMLVGNEILGAVFVFFIVNSRGKNEFKIAWMLPVVAFPIFGISMYFMAKHNTGWTRIKRKLVKTKRITNLYTRRVLKESGLSAADGDGISDIESYLAGKEFFPAFKNCRTKYYASAEAAFPSMLEELKKAQKFIFLDYFIIDISQMWDRIFDILKEKAKAGVKIRILFDSIGSINIASKSFCRFLDDNGIEAREFMPMIPVFNTGLNDRDHHKIMDIDGRICFTGGANITDEYINLSHPRFSYWKDSVISVEGSAAISFTKLFLQIWHTQEKRVVSRKVGADSKKYLSPFTGPVSAGGTVIPYGDDGYNGEELAENVYRYILARAKKYVRIITPYLILDNKFLDDLIFAAKRKIDIEILFPAHFDHFLTYCVGLRFVKILIKNGIKVYFYEPGFIHSKIFLSDGDIGTVGSINLDYRSLCHHFECGVLLYKTESIKEIEDDFEKTKAQCTLLTPEIFNRRVSNLRRALGWICQISAPLM